MTEWISTPEFEEDVTRSFAVPALRPEFVSYLNEELLDRAARKVRKPRRILGLRPAWVIAAATLLLLVVVTLAIGPQRVYAEVAKLLGYIPGVGIVDENSSIRVLAEPVFITRDGITVTVTSATLTDEKTVLLYQIENVPNSALSHDENISGCATPARLILSNGSKLYPLGDWGSFYQRNDIFEPIAGDITVATFVLPCIFETLPGKAPENWALSLHFAPAPADFNVAPILDLSIPTVAAAKSNAEYGIKIVLDQAIPLTDGYYLVGHTEWNDNRIFYPGPAGWSLKAYDANGQEVPLEPVDWRDAGLSPHGNQWLYRLYGKNFAGPLTLRASQMGFMFEQPAKFSFDLSSQGFTGAKAQVGRVWKNLSIPIDFPGISATVKQITYIEQGDLKGFEFGIEADPMMRSLSLSFESGLDSSGLTAIEGAGDSIWDRASGLLLVRVLTNAKFTFPLLLSAGGTTINGNWQTSWNPPVVDARVTPTSVPQACVSLEKWQQALKNPGAIPSDLPARVLINRGALAPAPSIFLENLDGSNEQGLVFGHGSLSADGERLVYADNSGNIWILHVKTEQKTALTSGMKDALPLWSPDDRQIAFVRQEGAEGIYLMDADGTGLRRLVEEVNRPQLGAWAPDGSQIIFWVTTTDNNSLLKMVNPTTGKVSDLFTIYQSQMPSPAYSPDGQWIAYLDKVAGRMASGLYISHPDGTDRRLMIQLDYWILGGNLSWSPDGKWVSFNAQNTELAEGTTAGLVNVDTCQVTALPHINGAIQSWVGN